MTLKQVSQVEFYAMMDRDVHPQPVGPWPYTSIFKTPGGVEFGRIVPAKDEPRANEYFLVEHLIDKAAMRVAHEKRIAHLTNKREEWARDSIYYKTMTADIQANAEALERLK